MDHDGRVPIEIVRTDLSHALVLSITGDIDAATIPTADARLRAAVVTLPPPAVVVIDLTAVRTVSAAGARLLTDLVGACTDKNISVRLVVGATSIVRRVITIAGVGTTVPTFDDLERALGHDQ